MKTFLPILLHALGSMLLTLGLAASVLLLKRLGAIAGFKVLKQRFSQLPRLVQVMVFIYFIAPLGEDADGLNVSVKNVKGYLVSEY